MAAITWTDVTNFVSALSTVSAAAQTDILAYVNTAVGPRVFGGDEDSPLLKVARIYLAAHHGTLAKAGISGALGPVTLESGGGITRQYASSSPLGTDPLLDKTTFGQAFRFMVRSAPGARGPGVAA